MLPKPSYRRMLVPIVALFGGLMTSALLAAGLWTVIDARDHLSFERRVDQAQDAVRDRLDTYLTVLRAGVGLFNAAHLNVDKESFQAFAAGLRLRSDYPGIQGLGFSARVAPNEADAFVAAQRRQGTPSFRIWPDDPRPEFHTIIYLEPRDHRNEAALGYDMFSEPIRRAAMEEARDTGQPAASGRVELVQEIDNAKQAGFLIYVPVYRDSRTPGTVAERRSRLAGFIYSPFRADDLFTAIFRDGRNPGLDLGIYDGAPVPQNLLHRSDPPHAGSRDERAARYTETRTLDVAGRHWSVVYRSSRPSELNSSRSLIPVVFAGGLAATLLVSGALWAEVRARSSADRTSEEAQLRAHELAVLNRTGAATAAELDLGRIVQIVTDAGVELTGAQSGAFFSSLQDEQDAGDGPGAIPGMPREAYSGLRLLRSTADFSPTTSGGRVVRCDDTLKDSRCGRSGCHPRLKGDLPVRSYLAVSVASRSGEVLGELVFGHVEPGMFSEQHERLMSGIAAQAAVALDNARLFRAVQSELQERRRIEQALRESEARLHLALEAGLMAIWELDIPTDVTTGTPELNRLFGFSPDQDVNQERIRAGYPAGERERLLELGRAAIARGERFLETEFRYRQPGGDLRWFLLRADIVAGPDGGPKTAIGVIVDVTERRRAEEGLRESEERLRLALEAGALGSWELDTGSDRCLMSRRSAEIFGLRADEVLDREEWLSAIHREDRSRLDAEFDAALEGRTQYRTEFRVLPKDGQLRWVSSQAIVRRDSTGKPLRAVGIHLDVTARKRWEEHQRLLINELNHRVKNTLATVQSVASQSLRGAASKDDARSAIEARLLALSRAHDVLTRENWEGASLREIVAQAMAPYDGAGDGRVRIAGPALRLPPRMALALAMALQELATNAVKYGALSTDQGEVEIRWSSADPDTGHMRLTWREHGGPSVMPPARRGFGTRLIERSLTQDLGGEVTMEFLPDGLACTVDMPLPTREAASEPDLPDFGPPGADNRATSSFLPSDGLTGTT